MPALAVLVDNVPLSEDEARTLWSRFSAWMEDNRGDLEGFAKSEGFVSVHPGVRGGVPTLLISRTTAQQPYGPAKLEEGEALAPQENRRPREFAQPKGDVGGSDGRHNRHRPTGRRSGQRRK